MSICVIGTLEKYLSDKHEKLIEILIRIRLDGRDAIFVRPEGVCAD